MVIKIDLSVFVTMQSGLCEQHVKSLSARPLVYCEHPPPNQNRF